jgi:hypothetical protein
MLSIIGTALRTQSRDNFLELFWEGPPHRALAGMPPILTEYLQANTGRVPQLSLYLSIAYYYQFIIH